MTNRVCFVRDVYCFGSFFLKIILFVCYFGVCSCCWADFLLWTLSSTLISFILFLRVFIWFCVVLSRRLVFFIYLHISRYEKIVYAQVVVIIFTVILSDSLLCIASENISIAFGRDNVELLSWAHIPSFLLSLTLRNLYRKWVRVNKKALHAWQL